MSPPCFCYGFVGRNNRTTHTLQQETGCENFTPKVFSQSNLWRPSDWQWPVTGDALVEVGVKTYIVLAVKEYQKMYKYYAPLVSDGIGM